MRVRLEIRHEIEMTPVYSESHEKLFERFLKVAEREIVNFDTKKLSNRVFRNLFRKRKKNILKMKKELLGKNRKIREKKILYDLFHNIFRNYRWACDSGSEREIEIKVWIASSVDKIETTLKILERNVERD
ncbi:hypothetical protein [Desulfurobacterium sp.]|uniref:hypothetical protein n=1 Tax=Desulfurobacterium sp. TaxID=2004706 RepID=UPI00260C95A2|nr:hypothetical protein [Desulfurobacterium sp.]